MNDEYIPKMAIIVYQQKNDSNSDTSIYLERRSIRNGKFGAGAPLTHKCIGSIMSNLTKLNDDLDYGIHGTIPDNLLYNDTRAGRIKLIWYRKPEKRKVYFKKGLGIPDGDMQVPGLLYVVNNDKLALYAFKGNKPKSKLYRAPFMNVNSEYVCLGSAKVTKPKNCTYNEIIEYWEKMFWNSEFSHILGPNPINGNLATITKQNIISGDPFPIEVLLPIKEKLSDFLR